MNAFGKTAYFLYCAWQSTGWAVGARSNVLVREKLAQLIFS